MARVTFSLDDATVEQIRRTAARLQRPQSHVVRDAGADYAARTDRLSERERQHLLGVLERLRGARPTRPAAGVDDELKAIRAARQDLFPSEQAVAFGHAEAAVAARLYKDMPRVRGREIDLAVAACAMANGAALWTLNSVDFRDIPGLRLL